MHINQEKNKKSLEFELNLIPFIDMLSACLCFLLLTVIWTYIGTIDTSQAIGAESAAGKENPPSIVVQLDPGHDVEFQLKDVKTNQRNFKISAKNGEPNWSRIESALNSLRQSHPEILTSVVLARPNVTYGHTIKIVNALKKAQIKDVGISPI